MIESLRPATRLEKFKIWLRRILRLDGPPHNIAADVWKTETGQGREVVIYATDDVLDKLYGVTMPDMYMKLKAPVPLASSEDCRI